MKKLVSTLALGLLVATTASGGDIRIVRSSRVVVNGPATLGAPVVVGQAPSELPMPAPLPTPIYDGPVLQGVPQGTTTLLPAPELQYDGPSAGLPVMPAAVPLFHNVKYRNERKIAPCSMPVIVQVPDPCRDKCNPAICVNVEICVPTCGCPKVKVTRRGNKLRYDYGKYAVDVVSQNGRILVDYDN